MRLIVLTSLVMAAFAANSVLNRMALINGDTGPAAFAAIRLFAGAFVLFALINLRSGSVPWKSRSRPWGVLALASYMLGFSFAYVTLDAGIGALILFGGVQVTMFIGALMLGETMPRQRWFGAVIAFGGLIYLLWPSGTVVAGWANATLMCIAAIGWGAYSLLGRRVSDPLGDTAANFIFATPIAALVFLWIPDAMTLQGAVLGAISGAVTSAAGYALWYWVLPQLRATVAAVAQLTVPLIALVGGMIFLNEPLTLRFAIAAIIVIFGVLVSIGVYRTNGSSGS